ncbi:hypothetical protein TrLO_g4200 [Triparma laevis f. longispina]|uniref:Uncharacterized protein n=1 Tax=Triparma laevis f. longispina TaxID=1714387 RepID=A0A9W7FK09_9STRA|nr:hypothetical protein TrLO_g4200 [Triparma laevis f. longispina]
MNRSIRAMPIVTAGLDAVLWLGGYLAGLRENEFDVGVYCESLGARGLWPTSYKNIRQPAIGECFNEYFRKQFHGNEEPFLKWKEVFDVLETVRGRGCNQNVRVHLETQVLSITKSEDLVKLRTLAKLCSNDFFDDPSLLVVVC